MVSLKAQITKSRSNNETEPCDCHLRASLVVAVILGRPHFWWVPLTVLFAGLVDLRTRAWVMSPRLGSSQNLSMALKFVCALFGLYSMSNWFASGL